MILRVLGCSWVMRLPRETDPLPTSLAQTEVQGANVPRGTSAFTGTRRAEETGSSCRHSPCGDWSPTRPGRAKLGTASADSGAERRHLTEQAHAARSPAKRVDHTSGHANISASGTNHPMFHAEHMGDSIPPTNRAMMTRSSHCAPCASHFSSHKSY